MLEIYELRVSVIDGGQRGQCVFHYQHDNTDDENDYVLADLLTGQLDVGAPATSWMYHFRNCLSEDAYVSFVSARRVAATGGNADPQRFLPAAFPGLQAFEAHAQQVAGCIIWLSSTDMDKTGRTFMPAVPENFLESSRWTSAGNTFYAAFITKFLTGISTAEGGFFPVIYDAAAKTGRLISDGYLSPKVGTQRRREVPL